MKLLLKSFLMMLFFASALVTLNGCNDDEDPGPKLTGNSKTYNLEAVSNPAMSGTVTFAEQDDNRVRITVQLTGTQAGGSHPAHLHANSAAESGPIVLDLTAVNGSGGKSETIVGALKDGTAITYNDFLSFDGHINVHASADNLGTLIAQGDIGQNELTGDKKVYTLSPITEPNVSGTATFAKRVNGETLVTVSLTGTANDVNYPSHIHNNSAVETGGIAIGLNDVNGTTGEARTNVSQLDDGTAITYEGLLNFDGYLNVHSSNGLIAQGDIGQNELTGDTKVYTLNPVTDPGVSGTATFAKRVNGETLVTVALTGTASGASYPSHIHNNSAAETGGIAISLNNVDGTTGKARTNVSQLDDGTAITYDGLLDFNGYLNVHSSNGLIAQGDIGQNELTGDTKQYVLSEVGGSGVSGTATFAKRNNGKTQITISLTGTITGGDHPAHIHANDVATTGGVVLTLANVNGGTGKSVTSANALNDGTAISYDQLITYNGHINIHLSAVDPSTLIAQGNIGSNAL